MAMSLINLYKKVSKKKTQDVRSATDSSTKDAKITPDTFKETVKKYVPSVSSNDDAFLEQLYNAFDGDNNQAIDFDEFVDGLSIFTKGTPEDKLALSFKLYDVNHDGYLTNTELERVMLKLSGAFSKEDKTTEIKEMVEHMFRDFDVDNDGRLSFEEYKLSAMKEPLIVDFLEQFIAEHHLSTQPRPPSRAASIRSYISQNNRSSSRLSVRLSQAELLEFSRSSTPPSPLFNHKSLSRPISMISIDAALNSMEDENDNNDKLPITLSTA